uniref:Sigma-70 family RNA polymerase sigma factor n=1 Tax=Streptomyces sp. NBC_01401 TaxID=2903854 RepID=A0AAU3GK32_9ACTN
MYGWRVLRAWMRDGTIIARCRESRIYFPAPYTEVEEMMRRDDVRQEIAIDCLGRAVPHFLAHSLEEWKPDGGRSLNTFFLHLALAFYRDAYRKWAGGHRRRMREILGPDAISVYDSEVEEWIRVPVPSPEERTVLQETLDIILTKSSMEERAVCEAMLASGGKGSQEEIAQQLGTTRKAVERRINRVRRRAEQLAVAGVIVTPSVSSAVSR